MNNTEDIITDLFAQNSNAQRSVEMSRYMRDHFQFYGIPKPLRAAISKPILLELKRSAPDMQLVHSLWQKPQRELQYFCLEYLDITKKLWSEDIIKDLEKLIVTKSWWDTVDTLAVRLVGDYFKKWPGNLESYAKKWADSDNMWLNRIAILFQLKYKEKTDLELLHTIIRQHSRSDEFFIQKAIGWALREYYYTDSQNVIDFINSIPLKPLSKREALKHHPKD